MQRIKDTYLEIVQSVLSFSGKNVLEIGCGDGVRTAQIAKLCESIVAVDPDAEKILMANQSNPLWNGTYLVASASHIPLEDHQIDVVFFTLSFHHVPIASMLAAIDEALRVLKPNGHLIFFEPAFAGTFFEAEILFDACDGDERKEKAAAYAAMLSHGRLVEVAEKFDETIFRFASVDDFIASMRPVRVSREEIESFLQEHDFTLRAERRINVFTPSPLFNHIEVR